MSESMWVHELMQLRTRCWSVSDSSVPVVLSVSNGDSEFLIACHARSPCLHYTEHRRNLKPHSSGNCWNYTGSSVALLWLGYKDLDILTTTRCRKYKIRSCGVHDISIRWCMLVALFSLGKHCTLKNNKVKDIAVINHNQSFVFHFRDIVVMLNMSWKKPCYFLTW